MNTASLASLSVVSVGSETLTSASVEGVLGNNQTYSPVFNGLAKSNQLKPPSKEYVSTTDGESKKRVSHRIVGEVPAYQPPPPFGESNLTVGTASKIVNTASLTSTTSPFSESVTRIKASSLASSGTGQSYSPVTV